MDQNHTIQEAYSDYLGGFEAVYGPEGKWFSGSIGSLNLKVGSNGVLTTAVVPFNQSESIGNERLTMYLFFNPPDGPTKRYAIFVDTTTGQSRAVREDDNELPPTRFNTVSCQIQDGTETIFGVSSQQKIEQWYRPFNAANSSWTRSRSILKIRKDHY